MDSVSLKTKIDHKVIVHCEKIRETIEATDLVVDKESFEKMIEDTPFKYKDMACRHVMDTLFEVASEKMKTEEDKEILSKLRNLVGIVERDLYDPTPRYLDCLFFPDPTG